MYSMAKFIVDSSCVIAVELDAQHGVGVLLLPDTVAQHLERKQGYGRI